MENQINNERYVIFQHEEMKSNAMPVIPWHNNSFVF